MNIYVGDLSLEVIEAELRQEFLAFGQVRSVSIIDDKYIGSGQPRGYGFVKMLSRSEGEATIAGLNGKTLKNRVPNIIEALPLSDNGSNACYNHRRGHRFSSRVRRGE
jgi:cold-inducible RNA-binding protein